MLLCLVSHCMSKSASVVLVLLRVPIPLFYLLVIVIDISCWRSSRRPMQLYHVFSCRDTSGGHLLLYHVLSCTSSVSPMCIHKHCVFHCWLLFFSHDNSNLSFIINFSLLHFYYLSFVNKVSELFTTLQQNLLGKILSITKEKKKERIN